ncbi:MAG: hypothetical protein EAX96_06200 [Candidatus Lokiarchaeota archaeon]|nr:hypothetical protein [Candidatus Lokiarchaeota archaeon]
MIKLDDITRLKIKMTTISTLISGEIKTDYINKDKSVKLIRRTSNGKVAVPIYGVLRANAEKILKEKGGNVCDAGRPGTDATCGKCKVCSLFGAMSQRGRAIIDDLISKKDAKEIVHKSFHSKIDRDTRSVVSGGTLNVEEVEENADFYGDIVILNSKEEDLNILAASMEATNMTGLGGWVTRGRGKVKMEIETIESFKWTDFIKNAGEKLLKVLK